MTHDIYISWIPFQRSRLLPVYSVRELFCILSHSTTFGTAVELYFPVASNNPGGIQLYIFEGTDLSIRLV